jgi:hypothetical protein
VVKCLRDKYVSLLPMEKAIKKERKRKEAD